MSQELPDYSPYRSPTVRDSANAPNAATADMTVGDWLLCIFCGGIGCILGIVRLIQGKPNAGKMIGFSILFSFLWGLLRAFLETALQSQ